MQILNEIKKQALNFLDDINSTYSTNNLSLKAPNMQETEEQNIFYVNNIVQDS